MSIFLQVLGNGSGILYLIWDSLFPIPNLGIRYRDMIFGFIRHRAMVYVFVRFRYIATMSFVSGL